MSEGDMAIVGLLILLTVSVQIGFWRMEVWLERIARALGWEHGK